jgi:hypothetical protein
MRRGSIRVFPRRLACVRVLCRFEPAAARRLSNRLRRFPAPTHRRVTERLPRLAFGSATGRARSKRKRGKPGRPANHAGRP